MKLLIQPGDGVSALLNAIDRAKATVEIAIFRFGHPGIEEALKNAVKRGVSVQALIAHVNGSDAEALRRLEMRLLAAGVTVARTDTGLARYHAKYLIIDRQELFVLAFNFTHQDIDVSRSFGLIIKNRKLVTEAVKLFAADSGRQPYKPASPNFIVSPLNARKQLSAFIKGAKSELLIYDPKISDTAMLRILQEQVKAGVSVRVIGRISDNSSQLEVRRLGRMRLHTRSIVRDRKSIFIGSQSLRELELDGRREVGVVCRDRRAVNALLNVFEDDWAASDQSKGKVEDARPVARVAKKVAKALTKELPAVGPVVDDLLKEVSPSAAADLNIHLEEIEETVRMAVKEAVQSVVQQAIEQKVEVTASAGE